MIICIKNMTRLRRAACERHLASLFKWWTWNRRSKSKMMRFGAAAAFFGLTLISVFAADDSQRWILVDMSTALDACHHFMGAALFCNPPRDKIGKLGSHLNRIFLNNKLSFLRLWKTLLPIPSIKPVFSILMIRGRGR